MFYFDKITSFTSISIFLCIISSCCLLFLVPSPLYAYLFSLTHGYLLSSLLPYTGRFHPHALRLVVMVCISPPLRISRLNSYMNSYVSHSYSHFEVGLLSVLLELHIKQRGRVVFFDSTNPRGNTIDCCLTGSVGSSPTEFN